MGKYDVLVSGMVTVDVIFSSIPNLPKPGEEVYCEKFEFTCGSSYITAVALARLGMRVAIAAPIGNDFLSNFIIESLEKEGVSTEYMKRFDQPLQALSVALNYGGDRSFISYEDSIEDFNDSDYVDSVIKKIDVKALHISAVEDSLPSIKSAKEKGITVFLDVGWDECWLKDPQLKEIIKLGDFFTPNLKEALVITGEIEPEKALDTLSSLNKNNTIIVKTGEEGALFKDEKTVITVPGFSVDVVDTTGAGDVFLAGLIVGILKGFELKEAIRIGNYCGGCSVQGMGGTQTTPYWSDVLQDLL